MKAQPPFAAKDVQSGSQVRCLPPRQPSRYGRDRDDVEPDRDAWHSPAGLLIRRNTVATVSKHPGGALSKILPLASWLPRVHFPPSDAATRGQRDERQTELNVSNQREKKYKTIYLDICIKTHLFL